MEQKLSSTFYFVSAPIFYSRLTQGERSSSERKSILTSTQSVLHFDDEMYLTVTGIRRCTYCRTQEVKVRFNIEYFIYKLAF